MNTELQTTLAEITALRPVVQSIVGYTVAGAIIGKTVGERLGGGDAGVVLTLLLGVAGAYTGTVRAQAAYTRRQAI